MSVTLRYGRSMKPVDRSKFATACDWWRHNHHLYPNVARVAKRYLCTLPTSVASERMFSSGSLQACSDSSPVSERPYPSAHCILVSSADTQRHLHSANRHLLVVPRFRLNTYGRRAFSVAGPMAWNSLPDFIRDPTISTDCFRCLLKTYLFACY